MRQIFLHLIVLFCLSNAYGQHKTTAVSNLTADQINKLFPDSVKRSLDIDLPIVSVYKYADLAGNHYSILTETNDGMSSDTGDSIHQKIKVVTAIDLNGSISKIWEINDYIVKDERGETSISYWTNYIDFRDIDGDGLIDPIIVYSTKTDNGFSDGRVKILLYYKGQKIAIRALNGTLDGERKVTVDKAFYDLPVALQLAVKLEMEQMEQSGVVIFPRWREPMNHKKTNFDDRYERER